MASEPRPPAWAEEQSGEDSPPARAPEAEDTALSERMFGGDDPAEAPEDERGDDDSGDTDADLSQRTVVGPGADALWVSAALGFAMRSFEQSGGDRLTRYEGEAYPELTLSAEVYPGAWFTSSFWRNLGLAFAYSRHLSISSSEDLDDEGTVTRTVDSSSQQLTIDALVRWPILAEDWTPVVAGLIGWGFRSFDLGPNDVVTSFNYRFLRLGARVVAPLGTQLVALEAGGDIRPVFAVGQEAVNAYGSREGSLGWSVRVGASGRLPFGLTYFASFEYLGFSADFGGRTDLLPEELLAVDRAESSSASDSFLRFWLGAGYAL